MVAALARLSGLRFCLAITKQFGAATSSYAPFADAALAANAGFRAAAANTVAMRAAEFFERRRLEIRGIMHVRGGHLDAADQSAFWSVTKCAVLPRAPACDPSGRPADAVQSGESLHSRREKRQCKDAKRCKVVFTTGRKRRRHQGRGSTPRRRSIVPVSSGARHGQCSLESIGAKLALSKFSSVTAPASYLVQMPQPHRNGCPQGSMMTS